MFFLIKFSYGFSIIIMKKILALFLSALFIGNLLHVDSHDHESTNGYFFCSAECDNEKHRSFSHDCVKCINKNNKVVFQSTMESPVNKYKTRLSFSEKGFNNSVKLFNLYSRPPPSLL